MQLGRAAGARFLGQKVVLVGSKNQLFRLNVDREGRKNNTFSTLPIAKKYFVQYDPAGREAMTN